MTNETSAEDDSWKIHFSFTRSTTSALQRNNENLSNIYLWESTSLEESQPTFYIFILKQIFLRKDIETLRRIVLDPEEINRIVKQIETAPESLHEYEELEEVQLLTDIRQIPDVKCDIIDGKCFTVELPITDLIDPNHNLRRLLRDLQTYSKTLTKNIIRQIEIKEKQSTPATKRKSTKRSNRKIVKMRPITTYFPKEPKRTKETQKNRKDQIVSGKCSSHRVEIIQIDDDSDSSHQQTENEPRENHVDKEEKYSIIHDLFSLDADFYVEDRNCGVEKRGTPWMTAEVADADNTDVSVTQGCHPKRVTRSSVSNTEVCVTPGYHAKRITQSSISKKKKPKKNSTLKRLNRSKSFKNGSLADTVATDEVTDTEENVSKHNVELDAAIRKEIMDWCGGETFLTEESLLRSGMVTERDNGMKNKAVHKKGERNNHVTNNNNDDDDDDFENWCNKKSSELRCKRVLIHERDEESGCEENNNSFDCVKKSTKFRNKCVLLSDSEESDSGKNHRTHNNKKHSSKVTYKRVRTYDSDEVSDGDI